MATKPTNLFRWGTGGGAQITEPTEGKKDVGWAVQEKPPAQFWNWLANGAYLWIAYLDDLTNQILTWTKAHTFQFGITVDRSQDGGANGTGATVTGKGTGSGVLATGGATSGPGLNGTGGAPNGDGVNGTGTGTGAGVKGTGGGSNGIGVQGSGNGTSAGGNFTGGATGVGVVGAGGATSGRGADFTGGPSTAGARGTGGSGNAPGLEGVGSGTGAGVKGTVTGANGPGADFTGGTGGSGDGVRATGGGGHGIKATGGTVGSALVGQNGGATNYYPCLQPLDSAGNLRFPIDYMGLPTARVSFWDEPWRRTTNVTTDAATGGASDDFTLKLAGTGYAQTVEPTADLGARLLEMSNDGVLDTDRTFWYSTPIVEIASFSAVSLAFEIAAQAMTGDTRIYIGLTDDASGDPTVGANAVYFWSNPADVPDVWYGVAKSGGVSSGDLAMGSGASATFRKARIDISGSGTPWGAQVRFWVSDGGTMPVTATQVPAGDLRFFVGVRRVGLLGGNSKIRVGPASLRAARMLSAPSPGW